MLKRVTVFAAVPEMYRMYPEFQLCLKMFRESLPEGSSLITEEGGPASLRRLIAGHLQNAAEYVLVVKEPAMLITKGTVEGLLQVLERDPGVLCVLPSDTRGYRPGRSRHYYTLRGLERFARSLYDDEDCCMAYDGREAWMFLTRRATLEGLPIPDDPLETPRHLPPGHVSIALNAYIHPFIDYDLMTARADVLPFVPEGVKSLLDIGCHTGNFGASAKKSLGCRVVGSEINPQAAEAARARLDAVIGDILTADPGERFDCITCLDVLEHFVNADLFLQRVRALLNDDGHFLLTVPNVGHWSVVEDLLAGRWDYMPAGALCISHLRFFTRRGIESLLNDAGFRIVSLQEQTGPVSGEMADALGGMERAGMEVDMTGLATLSYYILAQKKA